MTDERTRRRWLHLCGVGLVAGAAGCLGSDDSDEDDEANGDDSGGNGAGDEDSMLEGFDACDEPSTSNLEELLPPDDALGDDFMAIGDGTGRQPGMEWADKAYREGGTDESPAAVVRYGNPPEEEDDLEIVFNLVETSDSGAIAHVIVDDTVFAASGFDEEMARELLGAFPSIDDGCVDQAYITEPEE